MVPVMSRKDQSLLPGFVIVISMIQLIGSFWETSTFIAHWKIETGRVVTKMTL